MKLYPAVFISFCLLFLLQGCSSLSVEGRGETAQRIAGEGGFSPFAAQGTYFTLQGYARLTRQASDIVIYIEGDGKAWRSRRQPSFNPTPVNPLAMRLADLDPAANVIYLARPCQYVELSSQPNCRQIYWTSHRFAPEVVDDYDLILSQLKIQTGAQKFHLVGFSGGAAVAALVAAKRGDVASLTTVAGNLDLANLARHHNVSPLKGSLDPADYVARLSRVPQLHFLGEKDEIIPPGLTNRFFQMQNNNPCLQVKVIPGATHQEGWEAVWQSLKTSSLQC